MTYALHDEKEEEKKKVNGKALQPRGLMHMSLLVPDHNTSECE
jgi:hypothetical protein